MNPSSFLKRLRDIRAEIRDEYVQEHNKPWIIGFSGGKDSTLLVQLAVESILSVAPDERRRRTYIVFNDTLVESPVFREFALRTLSRIGEAVTAHELPVSAITTRPELSESFWVNLLGRGYPAPNHFFRWCMDRLKIRPTARFIEERLKECGGVILLLGVRRAESIARKRRLDGYQKEDDGARLSPNRDIPGCLIFKPIIDLTTEDVWKALDSNPPPWGGGTTSLLFDIYRDAGLCNASSGCPSSDEEEIPESGSILARFGCWTCTVVKRDRSLASMIENGHPELAPLADFRERLKEVSSDPHHRSKTRRDGRPGLGPLTVTARRMLLQELLDLQDGTSLPLISTTEVAYIKEWWERDEYTTALRDMTSSPQMDRKASP